jgi:hypothetical protein
MVEKCSAQNWIRSLPNIQHNGQSQRARRQRGTGTDTTTPAEGGVASESRRLDAVRAVRGVHVDIAAQLRRAADMFALRR